MRRNTAAAAEATRRMREYADTGDPSFIILMIAVVVVEAQETKGCVLVAVVAFVCTTRASNDLNK